MVSNQKLFSLGNFDFRLQHLLVIGVLILSVSISMSIRSTPASHGFELFEFDPFFNLRATEYLLDNGSDAYFDWIDEKSWYPFGRNVSETSQVTLHFTSAYMYQIFGFGSSLYDFTVLFPLVIGSLTAVVVFAFVRVLAGTTAGLFAALIFSVSVPIFSRGLIGWFKSEPLGLFFAFIAMYLFISGIKFNHKKISAAKLITGGLFLALGASAWGGILFFIIPIAIFYLFKSYSLITNLIIISSLFLIFYTISDFVNSLRKKIKFDFPRIISHLGFGFLIFFIGINHNFSIEKDFNLKVGQSKVVENFKIDFENLRTNETQNYKSLIGDFKITKIDKNQIKFLKPEIRIYSNPETITYEASIKSNILEDYYLTMSNVNRSNFYNLKFQNKPFMFLIWLSAFLISAGGFLRLFSKR